MLTTTLAVLGVPTRFETNRSEVLDAIEESFGNWCSVSPATSHRLRVGITVFEHVVGGGPTGISHHFPAPERLLVRGAGCLGLSDPARREAVAAISEAALADREQFRDGVLEALTYSLISQFDRHPLHAAVVSARDRAARSVLLVGASGSGKSSLAYAAHLAGMRVLAEDVAWLQLEPTLRVWGAPRRVRLTPAAVMRVGGATSPTQASGRVADDKLLVPLSGECLPGSAGALDVCILAPGTGPARLEPLTAATVRELLSRDVAPGFDRFPERHVRVATALSCRGGWRLHLSADAREAIPLVRGLSVG